MKSEETRRLLNREGWVRIRVDGDCMAPSLNRSDRVLVRRADRARVGDVVLLDAMGWLEIHRVVGRIETGGRTWYLHKGDAGGLSGLADGEDLLGRVGLENRRPVDPSPGTHARLLAYRLGALLIHLVPGLRGWTRRQRSA